MEERQKRKYREKFIPTVLSGRLKSVPYNADMPPSTM